MRLFTLRFVLFVWLAILLCSSGIAAQNRRANDITRATADVQLRILQLRGRVYAARGAHDLASALLELNREVDRYARVLNRFVKGPSTRDLDATRPFAIRSSYFLVPVALCDPRGEWVAEPTGYIVYAQVWPDGPEAEEAWYYALKLDEQACGDYEGTREEAEDGLRRVSEFLERFPQNNHVERIRELKKRYETDLKAPPK